MNWQIHRYKQVGSTMTLAADMAIGSVVVADEQTAGIGRHGNSWDSPQSAGLYVSIVLAAQPVLTLSLGLAAHAAVRDLTSLECDIRWPNDLLLSGRKFAGIMVQMHDTRAVAGIGINIGQRSFPPDLAPIATSLALETDLDFHRDDLLQALLKQIPPVTAMSPSSVISAWERTSTWAAGKPVQVDLGTRKLTGVTAGLDAHGFLRVRQPDGTLETILAGGVRPL
jgi:BirA family biotin operon repressor/biotin-[acetyl-CoA-carboxylase] ligase